jgi:hypothetical protein
MPQAVPIADDDWLNRAGRRALASNERRLRPRFVSIKEAADYLGVCRATFYNKHLSKVKTVRNGRRNLVDLESLDRLIDEELLDGSEAAP